MKGFAQYDHALCDGTSALDEMRDEIFDPNFKAPGSPVVLFARRLFEDDTAGALPAGFRSRLGRSLPSSEEAVFITGADIPVDGGLRFKYPTWRPGDRTGVNVRTTQIVST